MLRPSVAAIAVFAANVGGRTAACGPVASWRTARRVMSQLAEPTSQGYWFPGRWVGGVSLVLSPVLLLAGVLLRSGFHYYYPQQLAAFAGHPALMEASYSAFVLGNVLMWPAIVTIARRIGATHPGWATWGGTLVILGLFTRTFHGGIDHLAFQLVAVQDSESATHAVRDSYGAFHIMRYLDPAIIVGWIVLAIGSYRSRTLGLVRSAALAAMAVIPLGTLKGTVPTSIIGMAALCVALVPLGIAVLREGPPPSRRAVAWTAILVALQAAVIYLTIAFPVLMN